MTTTTWTALPNLRALTLTEGLKLVLTVGSLSIIFLAGQLAQSRGQGISEEAQSRIVTAVTTQSKPEVVHRLTPSERYARSQIKTFSELLDALTERAEVVLATVVVSGDDTLELKRSLRQLDQDLMAARESYSRYGKSRDKFAEEDLRESLMAVQDSASRAQGQMITLDNYAQANPGFTVSRTGQ
jgi:hypothetical protein